MIIASVLVRCSIPVLHASAAMLKIAEMRYSGPNSIFLRVLLNKKVGWGLNGGRQSDCSPSILRSTRCRTE